MSAHAIDEIAAPAASPDRRETYRLGLARLWTILFAPVDVAGIVFFRIAFGALMMWEVWRYVDHGWIGEYYIEPAFHFTYIGFGWIVPWPGVGMYLHFAGLAVAALGILLGLWYRASAALFFIGYSYVFFLEQATFNNHYYLIALLSFLMILAPANAALSLDAWRHPSLRRETVPGWTLWSLRAMLAIPFIFGALAKFKLDWLRGEPMRLWLAESTHVPLIGNWFTEDWSPYLFSWGGLLFDLLIVPALLWHRTRALAFVAALLFHVTNAWLFPIGVFPPLMIAATSLFFPPSWPRLTGLWPFPRAPRLNELSTAPPHDWTDLTRGQRVLVLLLALFFTAQLVLPLRHFLFPGPVSWTEEGFRFAWHMRLRDKWGDAVFHVSDPVSGRAWEVDPDDELLFFQEAEMAGKPDMILQYAHHLARRWRAGGYEQVQVRADVVASLNGRRPQPLVDPSVDLAAQPRTLGPAPWVMPLTEPLPR
jgi:vitamin K-dependent gamma-carboxylase